LGQTTEHADLPDPQKFSSWILLKNLFLGLSQTLADLKCKIQFPNSKI
jgi:hypothetical protein